MPDDPPKSTVAEAAPPAASTPGPFDPEGVRRTATLIRSAIARVNPRDAIYMSIERAAAMRRGLEATTDPRVRLQLAQGLMKELLRAGETQAAIDFIRKLREVLPPAQRLEASRYLAVAYLRMAEEQNCVQHHGVDSCLMPIRGGGVHQLEEGARHAIEELTAVLAANPSNLGDRWLLNIAWMTVGGWPDEVPEQYLIPPEVFESEYEIDRFVDVAGELGVDTLGLAGGVITDDFDGDGDLDIMVSSWGFQASDQMRLYRNNADGSFDDVTADSGLTGLVSGLNMTSADYDNDGDVDVLVLRGGWMDSAGRLPNSLLRNDGGLRFSDVTEAAGLGSLHPGQVGTWGDYDNDGWVDLFLGNETAEPERPHPVELYRNGGDGSFSNHTSALGVDPVLGWVKGAAWGDYDRDGRIDLYVSVWRGANRLFHNEGPDGNDWSFREVGAELGVTEPHFSFPVWFWDYDNDGWDDIFVGGYRTRSSLRDAAAQYLGEPNQAETPRLYRNDGRGGFEEVHREVGLDRVSVIMAANFGDIDNDGWLDCLFGTGDPQLSTLIPNRLLRNDGGTRFQDVTTAVGVGHLQKGHAISFADIDADGDQDIYTVMGGAFPADIFQNALFLNPGNENHWITLRLEGKQANRAGIGARIRAHIRTPGGERDIYLTAGFASSFSTSSLQQELGLGDAVALERLEIVWPGSGTVQRFDDVAMDRIYRVVEDRDELIPVASKVFSLGAATNNR